MRLSDEGVMMVMIAVMVVEVEVVIAFDENGESDKRSLKGWRKFKWNFKSCPLHISDEGVMMLMIVMMVEEVRRLWLLWRR